MSLYSLAGGETREGPAGGVFPLKCAFTKLITQLLYHILGRFSMLLGAFLGVEVTEIGGTCYGCLPDLALLYQSAP